MKSKVGGGGDQKRRTDFENSFMCSTGKNLGIPEPLKRKTRKLLKKKSNRLLVTSLILEKDRNFVKNMPYTRQIHKPAVVAERSKSSCFKFKWRLRLRSQVQIPAWDYDMDRSEVEILCRFSKSRVPCNMCCVITLVVLSWSVVLD